MKASNKLAVAYMTMRPPTLVEVAEIRALEDALDFYAQEANWGMNLGGECIGVACDRGERARTALGRETDYSKFADKD